MTRNSSLQGGGMPATGFLAAMAAQPGACLHAMVLSGAVNVLMLTSPLFMMQVYDRVLTSRSVPTLTTLAALALLAYAAIWLLEVIRGRIVGLAGERMTEPLLPVAQRAAVEMRLRGADSGEVDLMFRDIDTLRGFAQSPAPLAFLDLPWLPIYIAVAFVLHPVIGWSVVTGIAVLAALTWLGEALSRRPARVAHAALLSRQKVLDGLQRNVEVTRALGMEATVWQRWQDTHDDLTAAQQRTAGIAGTISALSRGFRQAFQSAVLAVGALLVTMGELSGGAIIAATVLAGRAMAPVDQAIAGWRSLDQARAALSRLSAILAACPEPPATMPLPAPTRSLRLESVAVAAPGRAACLRGVTLELVAGDALGIIGHSASGKTSLARTLVGLWQPAFGRVLLDGADLRQYDAGRTGSSIGFMPQDVQLFDGTVAENIARFRPDATPEEVIAAAKRASFHQHALALPDGYDTLVGPNGAHLSSGQRQRIGLARALYGQPFLVVLDEPNANLDAEGDLAVARAIRGVRRYGGIAIVIAHRPGAISQVNKVLVLERGTAAAFGPKDEVLAAIQGKALPPGDTATRLLVRES